MNFIWSSYEVNNKSLCSSNQFHVKLWIYGFIWTSSEWASRSILVILWFLLNSVDRCWLIYTEKQYTHLTALSTSHTLRIRQRSYYCVYFGSHFGGHFGSHFCSYPSGLPYAYIMISCITSYPSGPCWILLTDTGWSILAGRVLVWEVSVHPTPYSSGGILTKKIICLYQC